MRPESRGVKCSPAVGAATEPRSAREHRLVTFAIGRVVRPLDVRRQRHVADLLELRVKIAVARGSEGCARRTRRGRRSPLPGRRQTGSARRRASCVRAAPALPNRAHRADRAQQEDLHLARQIFVPRRILLADGQRMHAGAMPEQARRETRANRSAPGNRRVRGTAGRSRNARSSQRFSRAVHHQHARSRRDRPAAPARSVPRAGGSRNRRAAFRAEKASPACHLPTTPAYSTGAEARPCFSRIFCTRARKRSL